MEKILLGMALDLSKAYRHPTLEGTQCNGEFDEELAFFQRLSLIISCFLVYSTYLATFCSNYPLLVFACSIFQKLEGYKQEAQELGILIWNPVIIWKAGKRSSHTRLKSEVSTAKTDKWRLILQIRFCSMRLRHARPNRVAHREQRPQNDRKEIGGIWCHIRAATQLCQCFVKSTLCWSWADCTMNELVSGSGWGQQQKRWKGGSAWRVQSLAATHQHKCGFIHSFIIYFLLILFKMIAFLTRKFGRISKINNTFGFLMPQPPPANTQSVND